MALREQQAQMAAARAIERGEIDPRQPPEAKMINLAAAQEVQKIRALPTDEKRREYKKMQFLPRFLPLAADYFEKGEHYQNDFIGYCLIYLCDIYDFERAFALLDKMIDDGQLLPNGWASTPIAAYCYALHDWADSEDLAGNSVEPYFSQAFEKIITGVWNLNRFQQAKWYKLAGLLHLDNRRPADTDDLSDLIAAKGLLQTAMELNNKTKVKTVLQRIEMRIAALKKAAETAERKAAAANG